MENQRIQARKHDLVGKGIKLSFESLYHSRPCYTVFS